MPSTINNNRLELRADNLGYQAARIQLPAQPSNADTMVFYYKCYVDGWPVGSSQVEDITSYGWNKDFCFGLSFNGSVSANDGGIVGWTNIAGQNHLGIANARSANTPDYDSFFGNNQLGSLSANGQTFGSVLGSSTFYIGSTNKNTGIGSTNPYTIRNFCPTTNGIGVSGADDFLGIVRIQKNVNNSSQVTFTVGTNWEQLSSNSFHTALTSSKTNWGLYNNNQPETTNFRRFTTNPSLSNTIVFPSWIVAKWPSGIIGRNFVITDIKVEYYEGERLITTV